MKEIWPVSAPKPRQQPAAVSTMSESKQGDTYEEYR
jgi:hypothetical protein